MTVREVVPGAVILTQERLERIPHIEETIEEDELIVCERSPEGASGW
jgi:hypothetical protein